MLVLLEPHTAARDALKAGFKELLARGLLQMHKAPAASRWQPSDFLLHFNAAEPLANPVLQNLWGDLRSASRHGAGLNQVLQRLQREYGPGYETFKQKIVLPGLLQRGLLQQQSHKLLGLFPQTRYLPTPQGTAIKRQLEQHLSEARQLIPSLADGKAEAAALLFSLGPALLLLPGLEPHFQQLEAHLRLQGADGGYAPVFVVPDSEAQESLERAFYQLDAALADGGDGGSDGGGGGE